MDINSCITIKDLLDLHSVFMTFQLNLQLVVPYWEVKLLNSDYNSYAAIQFPVQGAGDIGTLMVVWQFGCG
jgi:hypothetical protein